MKTQARKEVMFGGFGGQGIVTAGFITGQAAVLHDSKEATLTQVYGPEARGSACHSGVVISQREISYPYLLNPEIMVIMSQEAYEKFLPQLQQGGVLVVDSTIVKPGKLAEKYRLYKVPATELAEKLGRRIIANAIMLGFVGVVWDAVSVEALREAVKSGVPKKYLELNLKAFQTGVKLAEKALKKKITEH
ncbi:MAG: 2-oxoacid:acceptor oxidoreductase family protein [Candidatus Bathyarchaeota archaeon]|nr:MAG: 2-oxoacid:acceptor oxidoreductase family protein [Candidatus Bathyarchaeota archaeon]